MQWAGAAVSPDARSLPVRVFDASVYWAYHGGWKLVVALFVGMAIGAVVFSGPGDYEDCIFRHVTKAATPQGAYLAKEVCDDLRRAPGNYFDRFD